MLDKIINKVVQKTGISQEHAAAAVTTVVDFLKNKLPAPMASQLEAILNGEEPSDLLGSAKEKIASLFKK